MAKAATNGEGQQSAVTAGKVRRLGTNYTVPIPTGFLGVTGWPLKPGPKLIAELVKRGCIRLYLATEKQQLVEAMRLEAQGDEEALAVLADKYREVQLYTEGNRRVLIGRTIAAYLGIAPDEDRQVFVEVRSSVIYVMSLSYRNQRLSDYEEETTAG